MVRPYAIGRRNWLFNITPRGAEAACIVYSLVQTCLANARDPYLYMIYLMENHIQNVERIQTTDEAGNVEVTINVIDRSKLEDMLPYSEAYIKWEEAYKQKIKETPIPGSQEVPTHP